MNSSIPDPEDIGKLFVGGLSTQTTKESLNDYFNQFGEVVDCVVMKNNETGRSRGFGFVTYKDPNCVFKVLQVRSHELDGKRIDPKECTPRSLQKGSPFQGKRQVGKCKLFLGGLPPDITEDDIRHAMSKYGKVDQVVIMLDQETKKCRGFGFLSFELEESIEQACAERFVVINDKQIECKKAEPRANPRNPSQPQGFSRNQNGVQRFTEMPNMNQNNWNAPPNQPVYNMPVTGNYAGYPSYSSSAPAPLASTPMPSYNMQVPYAQAYQQNYANAVASYNYAAVPANAYAQAAFMPGAQPPDGSGNPAAVAESGKSYGSNEYSQNASSYGPAKATYGGTNAPDGYQTAAASSGDFQRYHPYKA